MEWDDKVDIWNAAVLLLDLVSSRHLFRGLNTESAIDESLRLAEMIAIMGPLPKEFLNRSDACKVFWGRWRNFALIRDITLESLAVDIEGDDKEGFLNFLRKILHWLPAERPPAEELVYNEWFLKGLGEGKGTRTVPLSNQTVPDVPGTWGMLGSYLEDKCDVFLVL
ncbi:hypothetical protein ACJ72_05338 [Emergomyces africanus]|uniref:Protein kinase domain-containing protein n=1 Tax=Emergomyces africanus TaxID=1955775 RepID=A0A1B7NUB3_9EURO|nr:hypothetical protein ACJ72_05338 [Emergomyces africanus]